MFVSRVTSLIIAFVDTPRKMDCDCQYRLQCLLAVDLPEKTADISIFEAKQGRRTTEMMQEFHERISLFFKSKDGSPLKFLLVPNGSYFGTDNLWEFTCSHRIVDRTPFFQIEAEVLVKLLIAHRKGKVNLKKIYGLVDDDTSDTLLHTAHCTVRIFSGFILSWSFVPALA